MKQRLLGALYSVYALQYAAVCCNMLQCVAVCYGVLQCATVLQCVVMERSASSKEHSTLPSMKSLCVCCRVCCSVLQCVAVCCSIG